MIGNLEPEENVMKEKFPSADMLGQLAIALGKMDWSPNDKLIVKIGGELPTAVFIRQKVLTLSGQNLLVQSVIKVMPLL